MEKIGSAVVLALLGGVVMAGIGAFMAETIQWVLHGEQLTLTLRAASAMGAFGFVAGAVAGLVND